MKLLLMIAFTVIAYMDANAQPGSLDKGFGHGGKLNIADAIGASYSILLNNNNILFNTFDNKLVNLRPDGMIDSSFGNNGILILPENFDSYPLVEQKDGKIVVGGRTGLNASSTDLNIVLYRFNSTGGIDSTFGVDGKAEVDMGSRYDQLNSLGVQSDGKIVGASDYYEYENDGHRPFVIRFDSNGTLDKSFGNNGFYIQPDDFQGYINSMVIQADDKIVTCGSYFAGYSACMVIRYNSNGFPDSSFSNDGVAFDKRGGSLRSIAVQQDGKIIGCGEDLMPTADKFRFKFNFGTIRFNKDGSLDEGFGNGGLIRIPVQEFASPFSIALQHNGKILIAGETSKNRQGINTDFALVRLFPNGELDSTFNDSGKVVTDFGLDEVARTLLMQRNGKILLTGYSENSSTYYTNAAICRYLGDPINTITKAQIKRWIKNHILHWQLLDNDTDVDKYVVEQNTITGFEELATVAKGTISFQLKHLTSNMENSYRVKAILKDGSIVYSNVINYQVQPAIMLYPNPVRDVLRIEGLGNNRTVINIADRNGNVLITATANASTKYINVSNLNSGVYYVTASSDEWNLNLVRLKFVKA